MFPVLVALLLLAQQEPEATTEQKQVLALTAQIRRLAASEQALYGVDTRIRTAIVLTGKYPKLAKEMLLDARAELGGINVAGEQDQLRVRIIKALGLLDLEEAERSVAALHRGGDEDYVAQAYDQLYLDLLQRPEARRMITNGLHAGGFRMVSASQLLEEQAKAKDRAAAVALFSEMLPAFPAAPNSEDVLYLLQQTRKIVQFNRPLGLEAIDKSLSAATSEKERKTQERMLREIVALLDSMDKDLSKRYREQHAELDLPPLPTPPDKASEEKPKVDFTPPFDLADYPYADALTRARKLEDGGFRTLALIELSRRAELTGPQQSSLGSEALSNALKMPMDDGRMVLLALISRDAARRGEFTKAGLAAEYLSETYSQVCSCPTSFCKVGEEKVDCLGHVEDFAEYLDEFKITPESMNLENISLEARLLILKLKALLGVK